MSKDLLLRHVCPHRTVREWLAIDRDFQTLRPIRDPASSSLQIIWNSYDLPREGLQGPVVVRGAVPGPFSIISGVNDLLKFRMDDQDYELRLPAGARVSIQILVSNLSRQLQNAPLIVSEQESHLVFTSNAEGKAANLLLTGGTAHPVLGLPSRRYYMGTQITSPWVLLQDPARPLELQARVISFSQPFASEDDIFEMSYTTRRDSCRRCNGLAIEDDMRYNTQGDAILTGGSSLMLQEVEKYILTQLGSNPFHNIGSNIIDVIGTKANNFRMMESFIVQEISQNLLAYQTIKRFQEKYQPVTDLEFLQRVLNIRVLGADDPTSLILEIELLSRAGRTEVLRDVLRLPSVLLNFNNTLQVR